MTCRRFFPALILAGSLGCSGGPTHQDVVRRQADAYEEMVAVLAEVRDEDGMAAAHARLETMQASLADLIRRARDLGPPTPEALVELEKERGKMQESLRRVLAELRRIRDLPGGEDFVKSLSLDPAR